MAIISADRAGEELDGQLIDRQPFQIYQDVRVAEPTQVAGSHSPPSGSGTRS